MANIRENIHEFDRKYFFFVVYEFYALIPYLRKDTDKLESVQRRATRLVPNLIPVIVSDVKALVYLYIQVIYPYVLNI